MAFFAKIDKVTGQIYGHGILTHENAERVPCQEHQMMIEVREDVNPKLHSFVNMETHDLLDADKKLVVAGAASGSAAAVAPQVSSPVKRLPVDGDKS